MLANLHRYSLSQDELFEFLRAKGVENLGNIREAYFEQNGQISIFTYGAGQGRGGLRIVPPWDIVNLHEVRQGDFIDKQQQFACCRCGFTHIFSHEPLPACPECQNSIWTEASVVRET